MTDTVTKTRTISILFTKYTDFLSRIVSLLSGREYTHVSISLNPETNIYYAFNTKGFRRELPTRYSRRIERCVTYEINVTEEQYKKLRRTLKEFRSKKGKYNWIGLIFALIRIPIKKREKRFYCSQFIVYLLGQAKIIQWKKNPNRYLPNHINKELLQSNLIQKVITNQFTLKEASI